MGINLNLYTVSEQHVDAILADPPLVWKVLDHEDADTEDEDAASFRLDEGEVQEIGLDKAWHGIHFLLTGSDWEGEAPLNFLLQGGMAVDEDDEESPRILHATEVQEVNRALSTLTADMLRERFDPAVMHKLRIYPDTWDRGAEELDYCLYFFGTLQAFMAEAARRRCGVLIFMG